MSATLRHTSHPQELVQLHVHTVDVFSLIVLWISKRERGKQYNQSDI